MSSLARATVCVTFDNLGEVTDLERGLWPSVEPLGQHYSVTRALPRILDLLDATGLRATFFVEGRNTELYPDALRSLVARGHEVAFHGWCHERWGALQAERERALFSRGVRGMSSLGLAVDGFRPPGGELTAVSLSLLRELGFLYCSPAGDAVEQRDGIVLLPFRWELIDAFHYLPSFASLRASVVGVEDVLPPGRLGRAVSAALDEAVRGRGFLALLFHPFLSVPGDRFDVLRSVLERVRALVDEGAAWCAPCREVAAAVRS